MYKIEYAQGVVDDLRALRSGERSAILDRVEQQLTYEPARRSRNRKVLVGLVPPWEYAEPEWELRIGEYRVFYDVDEGQSLVVVRAVRRKPRHKTTEEIL